ncbi:Sir2 family histone deacetylase Hst4 [Gaeumannomyces tritici R3-111a-1]|uniref:Sir2 family histone deacetylase Hst4 n=1 Tax=Gaeumannomyces tritici (strain R3-111a-1) TaxID=644352 RepID=J3P9G9_GAET3|nr:Sir2 family histone deacetylase Hst4 [Gaeumannomyces tritici R3-111a-1]EJT73305.1 Sir2 family histone deacetylase Hst4 [Gaeumannomyces tritici R3-111a-1]
MQPVCASAFPTLPAPPVPTEVAVPQGAAKASMLSDSTTPKPKRTPLPSSSPLSSVVASSVGTPSSPLSVLSNSPSLPSSPPQFDASMRYPSPSSTDTTPSGCASPSKPQDPPRRRPLPSSSTRSVQQQIYARTDGPPPAKRRKVQPSTSKEPRVRTTEYLDLEKTSENPEQEELLTRLMTALRKKKRIVVIAGAGISVSAGIPDFRSSNGLFTTLRGQHKLKSSGKQLFDVSVYKDDFSTSAFHKMLKELATITERAQPTPFHHMLASMAQEGRLMRLYTQNIDCLDTDMEPLKTEVPLAHKAPWPKTIQLHGGLQHMVCTKCGRLQDFDHRRFDGPKPPSCPICEANDQARVACQMRSHGIGRLRPRIVLYNEYNPDADAIGEVSSADLRRIPDAVIVVGTTLKIPGVRRLVREMCKGTRSRRDGFTAWINVDGEPQDFKDCWDLVVKARCDDVAELVNLPRWDQMQETPESDKSWEVTADVEDARQQRHSKGPVVNIPPSVSDTAVASSALSDAKSRLVDQGIPTPNASPRLENARPPSKLPTASSRAKQSTLKFGDRKRGRQEETDSNTAAKKPAAKTKKPRQPTKGAAKKGGKLAAADLTKAFKATKARSAIALAAEKKAMALVVPKQVRQPPSPDLSSLMHFTEDEPQLPSLRPGRPPKLAPAPIVTMASPRPSSSSSDLGDDDRRLESLGSIETISPKSKPRLMAHLID